MHWVVFLRAANVGKHNRFQPSVLAKELAEFGLINVGTVGTFVIREDATESALRAALRAKLPFECEMMVCRARDIVDLVRGAPFKHERFDNDFRAFASIMAKAPVTSPKLPAYVPNVKSWEVKIVEITGKCALSLWRRLKQHPLYPNEVIEKKFSVAATTRSWNTILKVSNLLTDTSD